MDTVGILRIHSIYVDHIGIGVLSNMWPFKISNPKNKKEGFQMVCPKFMRIRTGSSNTTFQEQLERLRDEIAVKAGKDRKLRGARVLGSNMVSKTWWNHRWARKPRPKVRRWRSCPANCRAARHWSKGGNGKPGMVDLMVHSGIALSRGSMIEIIVIRYENPYQHQMERKGGWPTNSGWQKGVLTCEMRYEGIG